MAEGTALSVIVVISSDTVARRADVSHLEGCLGALSKQNHPPAMEIIVPHHTDVDGIEDLSRRYPAVVFLPVPIVSIAERDGGGREHHDARLRIVRDRADYASQIGDEGLVHRLIVPLSIRVPPLHRASSSGPGRAPPVA